MAFVLHQTWEAERSGRAGAGSRGVGAALAAAGIDRAFWRTAAILLSMLVHILLIWVFPNKLAGAADPGERLEARSESLALFDLSGAAPEPAGNVRPNPPQIPAAAEASEVDATAATDLQRPEWSVSRLPPRAAPQASPAAAAEGGAGGGAGRGGGVYDPYAGAAPLRAEVEPQAASLGGRLLGWLGAGQSGEGLTLDEAALEEICRAVARTFPGQNGTATIVVRVSPAGMVLAAEARGGSAPGPARNALGRALVGKRLYRGSAPTAQTLTLPVLRLG